MPRVSLKKRGPLERIPVAEFYTTQDMSHLFSVSVVTIQKWIDKGVIKGIRRPCHNPAMSVRLVHHRVLMAYVRRNPDSEFVLDKLEGDLDFMTRDPKKEEVKLEPDAPARPRARTGPGPKDRNKNTWDW